MSLREMIVLGTSAEIPTAGRSHNALFLRWDAEGLLFDPGEGAQRQLIFADITATAITKILITHFHGSHCLGLAGICQRISLDRVPQEVEVYFPAGGEAEFERLRKASIYHNMAKIRACPVEAGKIFDNGEVSIEARALDHTVPTLGYRLQEHDGVTMQPEKLARAGITGRAIGDLQKRGQVELDGVVHRVEDYSAVKPGQSVALVMDTRPCASAVELAQSVDLLVAESTFCSEHADQAEARGHMTARQAAELAKDAGAAELLLTHFSPRYEDLTPLLEEARAVFEPVHLAKDCGRYSVRKRHKA